MPIDEGTLRPIFVNSLAAAGISGQHSVVLAGALASGLSRYLVGSIAVISTDVGTLGAGTGTGFGLTLLPAVIYPAVLSMLSAGLIIGPHAPNLADGISNGVSTSLAGAAINTINSSVGVGTGVISIVPDSTGGVVFSASFLSAGLVGPYSPSMGLAIGIAMDQVISSATGFVVIAGPTSPYPSSGVGVGELS